MLPSTRQSFCREAAAQSVTGQELSGSKLTSWRPEGASVLKARALIKARSVLKASDRREEAC